MQALSDVSFSVEAGEYNVRYYPYSDSVQNRLNEAASVTVKNQDAAIKETYSFDRFSFTASRDGDALEVNEDIAHGEASGGVLTDVSVIALPDYNRITGQDVQLKKGEVLIYSENGDFGDKVEILGYEHKAVEIKEFPKVALSGSWSYRCGIVTDSRHSMESMLTAYQKLVNREGYINGGVYINLDGTDDEKTAFYNEFRDRAQTETGDGGALDSGFLIFESRQADSSGYSVYGAFLFLGLFLGLVFIFATVMIIYYKQVSEGYDDRKRFDIMQKVGMTEAEVRQTIRSQVLIVFFLPLAAAAMHIVFAFPMIRRILAAFSMTNVTLFAVCTIGTFIGFAVIYLLVYLQTSGTYYSIVRR